MAVPLRVELTPDRAEAKPGEALALQVTVRNTSDVVEHYGLELLGLPEHTGATVEPDLIKLRPGESGSAAVRLRLSGEPSAPAGRYTVGVLARSRYRAEVSRCEELALDLSVVNEVDVRVEPDVVTGKGRARYVVHVRNTGNVPVRLALAATDPERRVRARFDPPLVGLTAGQDASAKLAIRAPVPWNRENRRSITLEATGDGAHGVGTATFVQRPRFASRLTRLAGGFGALGMLSAAILGAAVILNNGKLPWTGGPDGRPSVAPSAVGASAGASAGAPSPSAAVSGASSAPPSVASSPARPAATGPVEVDLVRTGPGAVDSDTFRAEGVLLSGFPDRGGDASCLGATALVVKADGAARYLATALPDKADQCNSGAVQIRFVNRAARVELIYATQGDRQLEVTFKDLTRTTVNGSSVTDDGSHNGIEFVVVSGLPGPQGGAPPPPAIQKVKFTPLG